MSSWEKVGEEASIVLVGNFNPPIFHPEWFIRHEIVPKWDYYGGDDGNDNVSRVATVSDLAQIEFPDQRNLTVMLNKFVLRCARASEFLTIKDIVSNTFGILRETPLNQMGMNYQSIIRIDDVDLWHKFGESMAPRSPWRAAAPYINDLSEEKQGTLGLVEMTMQMPRADDVKGYIRPTIKALNINARELSLSVNSHVVIEDGLAETMLNYLNQYWEDAIGFSNEFIEAILADQLREK